MNQSREREGGAIDPEGSFDSSLVPEEPRHCGHEMEGFYRLSAFCHSPPALLSLLLSFWRAEAARSGCGCVQNKPTRVHRPQRQGRVLARGCMSPWGLGGLISYGDPSSAPRSSPGGRGFPWWWRQLLRQGGAPPPPPPPPAPRGGGQAGRNFRHRGGTPP